MTFTNTHDHVNHEHTQILDFIRENSPLDTTNTLVNQIFENAYQLTAYERNGCIFETDLFHYLATECEPVTVDQMNAYNELNNDYDNWIYSMDEFNEVMYDTKPEKIAFMIHHGNFNPYDDYFSFDGYGNLKTFNHYQFMDETENGAEIKAALIENNMLEYFTDTDQNMILDTLQYKDIIIDTALYMVSLGY